MAGEEIELVSHLQREHVTRVRNGDILQNAGGLVPASVQQMADRGNMPGFLRRHRKIPSCKPRFTSGNPRRCLGAEQKQPGAKDVTHNEAGC